MTTLSPNELPDLEKFLSVAGIELPHPWEVTSLSSVILNALIPTSVDSRSIRTCIAARDLALGILMDMSCCSLSADAAKIRGFKQCVLQDIFSRLQEYLSEELSGISFRAVSAVTHALALILELIRNATGSHARSMLSHVACLSSILAVLKTAETVLIHNPVLFTLHEDGTECHLTGQILTWLVVMVKLVLRGLRTLSKTLYTVEQSSETLTMRLQLSSLIQTLIYSSPHASTFVEDAGVVPPVRFLLRRSVQVNPSDENDNYNMLSDSDQAVDALRLLLLLGLDLAAHSG
ncbi:unnamed protein product [Echinostoma caproni]|uniref:DUF908 domain-containing protein n=1 Tax=Echinostoma caproni TaxID=27848 RepID=A0A183AZH9_9TREM|nr:unnamed protein product [Echinostoma caproni]